MFRVQHIPVMDRCSLTQIPCQTMWHPHHTSLLNSAKFMLQPRPQCSFLTTSNKGLLLDSQSPHRCLINLNKFLTNRGYLGQLPSTLPRVHRRSTIPSLWRSPMRQATQISPHNRKWFTHSSRCFDDDCGLNDVLKLLMTKVAIECYDFVVLKQIMNQEGHLILRSMKFIAHFTEKVLRVLFQCTFTQNLTIDM